jgi:hypothetical protein
MERSYGSSHSDVHIDESLQSRQFTTLNFYLLKGMFLLSCRFKS